jgi:hypothetical protein
MSPHVALAKVPRALPVGLHQPYHVFLLSHEIDLILTFLISLYKISAPISPPGLGSSHRGGLLWRRWADPPYPKVTWPGIRRERIQQYPLEFPGTEKFDLLI